MATRVDYFKKIRKGKQIEPKTAFEKNYQLCWKFKKQFKNKSNQVKLSELIKLSTAKINNLIPYAKRRKKSHGIRKKCWVCGENAYYQHHIIQLQNGGYDNGINRIPICEGCHSKIHPFMV